MDRIKRLKDLIPKLKSNNKIQPLKIESLEWELKYLESEKKQLSIYGVVARLLKNYNSDILQVEIDNNTKEISVTKCEVSLDYYADYNYKHLEDLQP